MATRTWNGTSGSFTDPNSWSPAGVPQSGDTAVINSGTVLASGLGLTGLTINLAQTGTATATEFDLTSTTIAANSTGNVSNPNGFNDTAPILRIAGTVENDGTINFTGSRVDIPTAAGAVLLNVGTLNFIQSSPQISGGGTLQNNGTVAFVRPMTVTQIPIISTPITGSGVIELGINAKLDIAGSVAATQTVRFNAGANQNEVLQIDQVGNFKATVAGFSTTDLLAVTNAPYTNATYTSTGASAGTLNLFNGATLTGAINFTGNYTLGSFSFTYNDFGGGLSNLQISTSVNNAQFGNLPAGYNALPVYRFFDTRYGTHFFTADSNEKNIVLQTRADLVQETNGFGDVAQSDANAAPIYRFFDNVYGTHFFTGSASERDNIIATRPDLVYEPSSTFYEHATQQAGDVAVYRLFDTKYGTQFLTGDQGEYNGITTPGASTYRADLTTEGVAFYAPSGTFT